MVKLGEIAELGIGLGTLAVEAFWVVNGIRLWNVNRQSALNHFFGAASLETAKNTIYRWSQVIQGI